MNMNENYNKITEGKIPAIYFMDQFHRKKNNRGENFVPVDQWWPSKMEDIIICCRPGFFIAPLNIFFDITVGFNVITL